MQWRFYVELVASESPARDRAARRSNHGVSKQASTAPNRFEDALEKISPEPRRQARDELINALATATHEGWAGEGSQAVSVFTYKHAKDLLTALPSPWPPPDITAGVDGRIEFDWCVGPGDILTVSVGDSDRLPWASVLGSDRKRGVCYFKSDFPADLREVLSKMYP